MSPLHPSGSLHSATGQLAWDGGACLISSARLDITKLEFAYIEDNRSGDGNFKGPRGKFCERYF